MRQRVRYFRGGATLDMTVAKNQGIDNGDAQPLPSVKAKKR